MNCLYIYYIYNVYVFIVKRMHCKMIFDSNSIEFLKFPFFQTTNKQLNERNFSLAYFFLRYIK